MTLPDVRLERAGTCPGNELYAELPLFIVAFASRTRRLRGTFHSGQNLCAAICLRHSQMCIVCLLTLFSSEEYQRASDSALLLVNTLELANLNQL
jgi:hypothetical protein